MDCSRSISNYNFISDQDLDDIEDKKLTAFEKAGMEDYMHRRHQVAKDHIDVKISSSGERSIIIAKHALRECALQYQINFMNYSYLEVLLD